MQWGQSGEKNIFCPKKCPSKKDWYQSIKISLKILELNEVEVAKMSNTRLERILNDKIRDLQFEELIEEKKNKKKMDHLEYKELKIAPYLRANFHLVDIDLKILFFKWRTNMIDVRVNFKGNSIKNCRLSCGSIETQEHLFLCPKIGVVPVDIQKLNFEDLKESKNILKI